MSDEYEHIDSGIARKRAVAKGLYIALALYIVLPMAWFAVQAMPGSLLDVLFAPVAGLAVMSVSAFGLAYVLIGLILLVLTIIAATRVSDAEVAAAESMIAPDGPAPRSPLD